MGDGAGPRPQTAPSPAPPPRRAHTPPLPLPRLATLNPALPDEGARRKGRPRGLLGAESRPAAVATTLLVLGELPESSFRPLLPPKSPQIPLYQRQIPTATDASCALLGSRGSCTRALRACASATRREVPVVRDTPRRTRTRWVPRSFHTCALYSQSFTLLVWCEKLFPAIFTFVFLFPLFVSPLHVPFNSINYFICLLSSLTTM